MNDPNLLHKKSELVNTYRRRSKLLLKSFKRNQSKANQLTGFHMVATVTFNELMFEGLSWFNPFTARGHWFPISLNACKSLEYLII